MFALGRDPSAASSATVASARPWTLKQLREVVEELVAAKRRATRVRRGRKKPRETMREHVYTYLNHKFGVKAVIAEWAESIAAATERFAGVDCEMAVFDRIRATCWTRSTSRSSAWWRTPSRSCCGRTCARDSAGTRR